MPLEILSDNKIKKDTRRSAISFPKPITVTSNMNDENTENSPITSPMNITPFRNKNQDIIKRSPLKRSRIELEWDNLLPMNESPKKKRALNRGLTFPTSCNTFPENNQNSSSSSSSIKSKGISNISKSIGSKASSVRNLFSKTDKKKIITNEMTLKASMLSILLVHKPQLSIVNTLIDNINSLKFDELIEELYEFFLGHNQIKRLIDFTINKEVENTISNTTLFRETSCATKLISIIFKREGQIFLETILHPHIKAIIAEYDSYEIDPLRVDNDDNIIENQKTLILRCANILGDISTSIDNLSPTMIYIMKSIYKYVSQKWDKNQGKIAVNSFFFLRYISPCIVTPNNINIQSCERRALILVSKVLQSLSNNTSFGEKEDYMRAMNDIMSNLKSGMNNIFEIFSSLEIYNYIKPKQTKTFDYYKASELLQQKLVFHQYAIIPILDSKEAKEEFEEAITMFSNKKVTEIMKLVTQDLKHRGD